MNDAVEPNKSGMVALIGQNVKKIENTIHENKLKIQIANDNSPLQVVVSGDIKELKKAKEIFLKSNIKKYVELNVSAAFHSKFMITAQNKLNNEIDKIKFVDPICSIVSNYDASINLSASHIIGKLKLQMSNRVRWTESILNIEKSGENHIVEIGPGKVLSGLIKRISKKFDIISINNVQDLEKLK